MVVFLVIWSYVIHLGTQEGAVVENTSTNTAVKGVEVEQMETSALQSKVYLRGAVVEGQQLKGIKGTEESTYPLDKDVIVLDGANRTIIGVEGLSEKPLDCYIVVEGVEERVKVVVLLPQTVAMWYGEVEGVEGRLLKLKAQDTLEVTEDVRVYKGYTGAKVKTVEVLEVGQHVVMMGGSRGEYGVTDIVLIDVSV